MENIKVNQQSRTLHYCTYWQRGNSVLKLWKHWSNYCKLCLMEVVLSQNMVNPNSGVLMEWGGKTASEQQLSIVRCWCGTDFYNSIEIRNCNPLVLLWTFAPLHHESGTRVRGVIYNANTISSRQCVQAVSCHQVHTSCYKVRAMHKLHDHFLLLSPLLVPKLQPHAFWEPLTAKKIDNGLKYLLVFVVVFGVSHVT